MPARKRWTSLFALLLVSALSAHQLSAQAPTKPDSAKAAQKGTTAKGKKGAKGAKASDTLAAPPALTPKEQKKVDRKAAKAEKKANKPVVDAKNATAKCKDGTYTATTSRSGACSGHGGVAEWLKK